MKPVSLADVLTMDVGERLKLVHAIWDSIAEVPDAIPVTDAERKLLDARLDSYANDDSPGTPWDVVKARLREG